MTGKMPVATKSCFFSRLLLRTPIVVTLPLPPPVEGGGFKTLSPGGRGEGEGELETEILRRKSAHIRRSLGTRCVARFYPILSFETVSDAGPTSNPPKFQRWPRPDGLAIANPLPS